MATNPPNQQTPKLQSAAIEWLLDSDPSIRWQVKQDLMGASPDEVAAERAKVATEGAGAWLLALQGADGQWAGAAWNRGWNSTMHVLMLLRDMGLDPESEQAVRAAFPRATIIRPSTVFGPEDNFTNRFAAMAEFPFLPVIAAKTRFQPVYVRDLAAAIAAAALDPKMHGGKTYELAGPEAMSMRKLNERIAALAGCKTNLVDVPDFAAAAIAMFGFLPACWAAAGQEPHSMVRQTQTMGQCLEFASMTILLRG